MDEIGNNNENVAFGTPHLNLISNLITILNFLLGSINFLLALLTNLPQFYRYNFLM